MNNGIRVIVVLLAIAAGIAIGYYAGMASWNAICDYLQPNWSEFWTKIGMAAIGIILILFFVGVTFLIAFVLGYLAKALTE